MLLLHTSECGTLTELSYKQINSFFERASPVNLKIQRSSWVSWKRSKKSALHCPLQSSFFPETTDECFRELGSEKSCHIFLAEMYLFRYDKVYIRFYKFYVRLLKVLCASFGSMKGGYLFSKVFKSLNAGSSNIL